MNKEVIRASRLKVRRLGSGRTHYADIPDNLVQRSSIHGRDCRVASPPVAVLCGVVLGSHGPESIVVMRDTAQVGCQACTSIAICPPTYRNGEPQ